jgi:hypothetical protein
LITFKILLGREWIISLKPPTPTTIFMTCYDSEMSTMIPTRPMTWTRFLWSVCRGSVERYVRIRWLA